MTQATDNLPDDFHRAKTESCASKLSTPKAQTTELENACPSSNCGLTEWSCNRLQDLVYDDMTTTEKRKLAVEIREDMAEFIQSEANRIALEAIGEDDTYKPDPSRSDMADMALRIAIRHRNQLRAEIRASLTAPEGETHEQV